MLSDFIESGAIKVVRLTEIFRQAGQSGIVRAAHAINQGMEPESSPTNQGDFFFIEADAPEAIQEKIVQMVRDRIPALWPKFPERCASADAHE